MKKVNGFVSVSIISLMSATVIWADRPNDFEPAVSLTAHRIAAYYKPDPNSSWIEIQNTASIKPPLTGNAADESWIAIEPQSVQSFIGGMSLGGSFSAKDVEFSGLLSDLAYRSIAKPKDKQRIVEDLEKQGFSLLFVHDSGNSQAAFVVAYDQKANVTVAFKGTSTWEEWWNTNFAILPTCDTATGIGGHGGFQAKFLGLKSSLDKVLGNIAHELGVLVQDLNITFTGHSLGGALATHAAVSTVKQSANKKPVLVTFGAPATLDAVTSKAAEHLTQSLHIAQSYDLVPHTPLPYVNPGEKLTLAVPAGTAPHKLAGYRQGLQDELLAAAAQGRAYVSTGDQQNSSPTIFRRLVNQVHKAASSIASGLRSVASWFGF